MPLTPEEQAELQHLEGLVAQVQAQQLNKTVPKATAPTIVSKGPNAALQSLPDQLGGAVGVASANAPGATLAAQALTPGGNPQQLIQGVQNIIQNPSQIKEALMRAGQSVQPNFEPTQEEQNPMTAGQVAANAMTMITPGQAGSKAGKFVKDIAAGADEAAGVAKGGFQHLVENPYELFNAPTKTAVAEGYAKAEKAGEVIKANFGTMSSKELAKGGSKTAGKLVEEGAEILDMANSANNKSVAPTLIKSRKALDQEITQIRNQIAGKEPIGKTTSYLKDKLAMKMELRKRINLELDKLAPVFRKADEGAARQLAVDQFRTLNPWRLGKGLAASGVGMVRDAAFTYPATVNNLMQAYDKVFNKKRRK